MEVGKDVTEHRTTGGPLGGGRSSIFTGWEVGNASLKVGREESQPIED